MKKRALALAVVGACGLAPQVFAHELAYSKKDHIKVEVPGEAATWCKPEVELTIRRPVWDNQVLLTGLVAKLPMVLGKDCPAAKVTWKAVDATGNLYASGAGTAANLGIVTLASAQSTAQALAPNTVSEAPAPVATPPAAQPVTPPAAATTTLAPTTETAPSAVQPAVVESVVQQEPSSSPRPAIAPAESQLQPAPQEPAPVPAAPTAVAEAPTPDFGRSLVTGHNQLTAIADGAGCKWMISKSTYDQSDGSLAFGSTPAMPCPASGFAEGSFEKLSWKVPNTYRGDNWNRVYVHPSGLMFNKGLEDAVKGKALSFLSPKADQALFLLGEVASRQMKVYLAFQRPTYRVLGPFNGDPYYVVTTADESFALDAAEYKRAALEVFQLIKTTSPTTVDVANFYVAKNLDALYPVNGWGDDKEKIVRNRLGENRGQFYFDVQEGSNWAMQREQQRVREERRRQEQLAVIHTRVLERYEQIKAGMKDFEGRETEALAQMAGIKVRFNSPLSLQDPNTSKRVNPMMVHVTGKRGDYYEIDFPSKGRLAADQEFANEWYVVQVANMTPYLPLEDGRAVPTFRAYAVGELEACKQEHCADKVSFGAVLAREFPDAGIDFSWTPEVSQQFVNTWNNASAQIQ
ncbi:hypothetical protein A7D27_25830 [Pseudomonas sp. 1D4]|uniref:hypothetical protein n=1 Tax=Pseudomonadaceae TaxID=135621 RepID=UPI00084B5A59|nr:MULTISPECIES: hypothetical protein [Pseudomonas]OEC37033.1 hypothetical protein A7D27_25830 [Pseudomonas sp. 1D4]